jgi:broad specificity phosphatase PhoE
MFLIVRHGNTFESAEPPRRIGARTDLPLTAKGLAQADALGAFLAAQGLAFKRVLVSPLLRTRQTAEAVLRHLPAAPAAEASDFLREIDHGPDEDKTEEAVLARIGAAALAAWDAHAVAPPGWQVDAAARLAGWRDLFAQEQGPALLVTSNGAARFALVAAGLAADPDSASGMKLPTGGYGVIRRAPDGSLRLAGWGMRP